MPARTLIIGTAKHEHIRACLDATLAVEKAGSVSMLLLEREQGIFEKEGCIPPAQIHYFTRPLHPLSLPLIRAILSERPDVIIIVCGLYYDHDNVLGAVRSICSAFWSQAQVFIHVQGGRGTPPQLRHKPLWMHLLTGLLHLGIAAVLRLLAPVATIRAGEIFSTRIGHLAYDCEIYLCEKELGYHKGFIDLFHLKDNQAANQTLCALFARKMRICSFARVVHEAVQRFRLDAHEIKLVTRRLGTARDPECLIPATSPHLAFTQAEHARARQEMTALGIPPDTPFVCLLGRDPAYLEWVKPEHNDSHLQEPRNININDYLPTAEALADAGYAVLRMGSKVRAPLRSSRREVLDYAMHPARSDFMDIYFSATCRFFIGSGSGLQEVPVIFRTPCVLINCFQLSLLQACSPLNILLPQLIFDNKLGRLLRIDEILSRGMGDWGVERFTMSPDITLIRNTPDEIRNAAIEMHQRLAGTWQEHPDDEELQRRFWRHFKPSIYNSCFKARIGARFLRHHADALLRAAE